MSSDQATVSEESFAGEVQRRHQRYLADLKRLSRLHGIAVIALVALVVLEGRRVLEQVRSQYRPENLQPHIQLQVEALEAPVREMARIVVSDAEPAYRRELAEQLGPAVPELQARCLIELTLLVAEVLSWQERIVLPELERIGETQLTRVVQAYSDASMPLEAYQRFEADLEDDTRQALAGFQARVDPVTHGVVEHLETMRSPELEEMDREALADHFLSLWTQWMQSDGRVLLAGGRDQ